jgi:aminopeptidase N
MNIKSLKVLILFFSLCSTICAQDNMTDSVDALHYDLRLDIGNHTANRIEGSAVVTMHILSHMDTVALELCASDIDSVWFDGTPSPFCYDAAMRLVKVPYVGNIDDTVTITVFYRKGQHIMPQGWGGFYFDNNIYYNLGIALYEYPHNAGKAWFPCRDNFYDKATYHFEITAKPNWRAICTGLLDSITEHTDGSSTYFWTLNRQTPTYLVGVAVAPFHIIEREYVSEYGIYPALLGFTGHDSAMVWAAYDNMSRVIPMFERRFGPYMWDRVGYVSTTKGSMEHVGNVAFTTQCMSSQDEACLATMSHEFAHSWFGNLVTCATSLDMWINEGGASFCEEVAVEAIYSDSNPLRYKDYAKENLKNVLITAHIRDDGFKPVYGQTPEYTYGMTVYNKGATVWHSLRGYVGDSLFYAAMQTLFSRCAFQNIDSYQLRDSLSLYTGTDLTDFFDFHVFKPGFTDFIIDSIHNNNTTTTIHIQQKTYGTDSLANGNRVWVTFFSANRLNRADRLITFDGKETTAVFQLPFKPEFAIVDYNDDLSKASVSQELFIKTKGSYNLSSALFRAEVSKVNDGDSAWLYVTHHWVKPDTLQNPRYAKMADRYWQVTGIIPEGFKIGGRFYFSRNGNDRSLDNNLFNSSAEFEQLCLLYREDAASEWKPATSLHTGNSSQGYFVMTALKLGQYTLAVKDTSYVDIVAPNETETGSVRIYPNPTSGTVTIETDNPGEALSIDVYDTGGRAVFKDIRTVSGGQIALDLKSGIYSFIIRQLENNKLSSQKVQFMIF